MSGERGKGLAAESPPAAQVPVPDFVGILGLVLVSLGQAPLPRGGQLSQSLGEGTGCGALGGAQVPVPD